MSCFAKKKIYFINQKCSRLHQGSVAPSVPDEASFWQSQTGLVWYLPFVRFPGKGCEELEWERHRFFQSLLFILRWLHFSIFGSFRFDSSRLQQISDAAKKIPILEVSNFHDDKVIGLSIFFHFFPFRFLEKRLFCFLQSSFIFQNFYDSTGALSCKARLLSSVTSCICDHMT